MSLPCVICATPVPKSEKVGAQRIYCSKLCSDAAWRMKREGGPHCCECGRALTPHNKEVRAAIAAFLRRSRSLSQVGGQ